MDEITYRILFQCEYCLRITTIRINSPYRDLTPKCDGRSTTPQTEQILHHQTYPMKIVHVYIEDSVLSDNQFERLFDLINRIGGQLRDKI